ncbi:MAG: hypothetical protein O2820_02620 [Planctomycetota bacterium]|nr:hypothetical protein [Planctomycetota bacterium]MDA1248095.1 hypothetical protein [Planctomycetota bacterium]
MNTVGQPVPDEVKPDRDAKSILRAEALRRQAEPDLRTPEGRVLTSLTLSSEDTQQRVAVTFGLDFPRGLVKDAARFCLVDPSGQSVPLQVTPLSRWSDTSLRWGLLDFVAPEAEVGRTQWPVLLLDEATSPSPPGLEFSGEDLSLSLENGRLTFRRGDAAAAIRFVLTTKDGRLVTAKLGRSISETEGPVRWTRTIEGTFPGCSGIRFLARISTFRGTGRVKLDVRLRNSNRARHSGGLWDLGDAGSFSFQSFEAIVDSGGDNTDSSLAFQIEADSEWTTADSVKIYQDSSGRENWQSRTHVNAEGRVPCRFRGYQAEWAGGSSRGDHANPTVRLIKETSSLTVALPEFWQQFPKSIEADSTSIRLGLFPADWDDLFELQGGEQKTHAISLWLGNVPSPRKGEDTNLPPSDVRVSVPPDWHEQTKALPYFCPASVDPHGEVRSLGDAAIAGENSLLARRDVIDEFGWRNFGEVWADHEQQYFPAETPIISHYNNQFDMVYAGLLQFARTGDTRWVDLFDPLARHVIDIDIYHTKQDRGCYNGGLFWHTDHYTDAGTCSHRTYSAANAKPGRPYGGGPSDEHNYTTGLLFYYWQTGNRDARDAVLSLAEWVINADEGSQTIFGLIDDGPTGAASATASADFHGPGRGAGNSLNALLDGWLISGERRFLEFAESLIRRVIHPETNIESLDLGNVEARWSYTVFLSSLAKYLDVKSEAGEFDAEYEYAAASLAHFGKWMLTNERPFFDTPDKLEFPTETWAAQELRKANVLRLAAKFCDEPERTRMLAFGEELADRAWRDLAGFETKHVARSLVLSLTEGARDCWLRTRDETELAAKRPGQGKFEFGTPTEFVPQKDRVRAQLKSPAGLARALVKAASPWRWPGFIRNLMRHL